MRDYRSLPENVEGHTMIGFYTHEDGRMCMYHSRLARWTFDDEWECLRDGHPDPYGRK